MMQLESVILGRKWKMYYQPTAGAENVGGMACFPSREIYIRDDLKDEELLHALIHELTHAWMFEMGQGQNQLLKHHFDEEFICELMAIHGQSIVESAIDCFRKIKAQKKQSKKIYQEINRDIKNRNRVAE